jgi:hypothetical protein
MTPVSREVRAAAAKTDLRVRRYPKPIAEISMQAKPQPLAQAPAQKSQPQVRIRANDERSAKVRFGDAQMSAAQNHQDVLSHGPKTILGHRTGKSDASVYLVILGVLGVIIGGYLAYQQVPALATFYAGQKAGISARYPGYVAPGFSVARPVKSRDGAVIITFTGNADKNRVYVLTQEKNTTPEEQLKSDVKIESGNSFTSSTYGTTNIYSYNNGASARWLKNGIRYSISGNVLLADIQVHQIIDSL